jgi:hypothetical protein
MTDFRAALDEYEEGAMVRTHEGRSLRVMTRCPGCNIVKPALRGNLKRAADHGREWMCTQCRGSAPLNLAKYGVDKPMYKRIRQTWNSMKDRCTNPRNASWKRYGGRGITICERWMSFDNFIADMGARPEGSSIDRIDNDGNYEPGNCRWATPLMQRHNHSHGVKPRVAKNQTLPSGVYPIRGRFAARIRVGYRIFALGTYPTIEQAAAAYNGAALVGHGKFATLNPIEGQDMDDLRRAVEQEGT